jgi:hypothetical protein
MISNPPGESSFTWFQLLPRTQWMYVTVSGVAAHMVLASRYRDPLDVYNIYIGANRNTEVSLWKGTNLLQSRTEPNALLLSDMRYRQISWSDGRIRLLSGRLRNSGTVFLDYTDPSPFIVTAIALTGDRGSVTEWKILESFG